jgi:antitoxin (DNA-binding transcriptional repressor) of toxin-antitoxin stability system
MTIHVNQQEAEKQFSKLLLKVLEGEEIVISMGGEEIARIIRSNYSEKPKQQQTGSRVPGIDEGRFIVPDDFDEPLSPDILKSFEGEE